VRQLGHYPDIQLNRYICSDHIFRDVKQVEKLREYVKVLHLSLKEKFRFLNGIRRRVPSDAAISPNAAAPLKMPTINYCFFLNIAVAEN